MSGGNCPETPRQKMIGMMYLFLTALLAINVSGELLQAFVTMDEGFVQSRETVERKNNVLYTQFENSFNTNQLKVGKYWEEARKIKNEADSLVNHIQGLKLLFAQKSSGPEATPDNYMGIDNQDIAPQVMIAEKNGARSEKLKDAINGYKNLLLSYLDESNESDTTFISAYKNVFNTDAIKAKDVKKSWQSVKFEHVPLSASMAMLSKIQGDVRNAEADMVAYLFNKIDQASYKFTKVEPLVIPEDRSIIKGGIYRARILMAAFDETALPEITVNGKSLTVENGIGLLELPATSIGDKKWNGKILMTQPDGTPKSYNISSDYIVNQPNAVISPTKMNVFYEGVANPVEISVPGVNSSDLRINMSNVKFNKRGSEYLVRPKNNTAGKRAVITVSADIDGKSQRIGRSEFRIKRVPNPVPVVGGKEGGKISKNLLLAQSVVFAEMKEFDFELSYKVTKFTVAVLKDGYINDVVSNSNKFNEDQKALIKSQMRGSRVSIEDIRAVGPDGKTRKLGTLTFILD